MNKIQKKRTESTAQARLSEIMTQKGSETNNVTTSDS